MNKWSFRFTDHRGHSLLGITMDTPRGRETWIQTSSDSNDDLGPLVLLTRDQVEALIAALSP